MGAGQSTAGFGDVLGAFASGVTLVTVADGRDDVGTTVSAFCPVSQDPPLVLVSLMVLYPAELLGRVDRFAVTLLAATADGWKPVRWWPGARLMLDGVPHRRGELSGGLIPTAGLAAIECAVARRVPAGDHLLAIADVVAVAYVAAGGQPLIRFRGGYPAVSA
jgi:flavin reductase (DIM6/NTAB) family NADH-FMN oxidoreductase RutF